MRDRAAKGPPGSVGYLTVLAVKAGRAVLCPPRDAAPNPHARFHPGNHANRGYPFAFRPVLNSAHLFVCFVSSAWRARPNIPAILARTAKR
jgi:hypothetical protein